MIPSVGAVADIANAALYAAEGDWANAAMSAVSAVPGIGDTIAMANKGIKAAKGVNKALKAGKSLKSILKAGGKSGLKAMKGKVKAGAKAVKNWKETLGSIFKKKKTGEKHICTNGKCFTGDTLVCTDKGKVPIQKIRAGDLVYSRNEHTKEMGFRKVEEIFKTETHTLHSIEVNGETIIQTTAYHGFYVEKKGWVSAINLQKGNHLVTPDGIAEVTGTSKERFEEPLTMYNLHVEEWVSYFVSGLNLYVHNGNGHKGNGKGNSIFEEIFDTADNYKLSDDTFNNHILDRHGPNSTYGNKSHFDNGFDIKKGIDETLKSDKSIVKPNTSGRDGSIFEQTFTNPIGKDAKGRPINTLKVVIDSKGNVITAFPKK